MLRKLQYKWTSKLYSKPAFFLHLYVKMTHIRDLLY